MAMTLRLSPDDEDALSSLAEAEGISKQQAVIRAIRDAADKVRHESEVQRLSARGRERYADVLRRLGE